MRRADRVAETTGGDGGKEASVGEVGAEASDGNAGSASAICSCRAKDMCIEGIKERLSALVSAAVEEAAEECRVDGLGKSVEWCGILHGSWAKPEKWLFIFGVFAGYVE